MANAKELVTAYMDEVWVKRNADAAGNYVSADTFIQHNPHLPDGLEALAGFLPHLFNNLMPEGTWEVKRVIAEDDMVVVHSLAKPAPAALAWRWSTFSGWRATKSWSTGTSPPMCRKRPPADTPLFNPSPSPSGPSHRNGFLQPENHERII